MQRLSDISTIRAVMEKNGFSFSKALGQNFLINPSVCPRMAEMSGAADCAGAIEVGPGIGVLTYELSQVSKKVVTIELDKRLLPVLDETLADCDNVKVINDDVMKIDLHRVIEEEFNGEEVAVCANLPYYITSPVIMKLLEDRLPITSITVMVQKEAAERLCAQPGTRECGAVSAAGITPSRKFCSRSAAAALCPHRMWIPLSFSCVFEKNRLWMCTMKHFSSASFAPRLHSAAKRPSIPFPTHCICRSSK